MEAHLRTFIHIYRDKGIDTYIYKHTQTGVHIYIYANFIKHNRHFMPTYFLLDPFEFPYYFYRIRGN